jgi:diguanylate cyclase (GGDEF)-like protein
VVLSRRVRVEPGEARHRHPGGAAGSGAKPLHSSRLSPYAGRVSWDVAVECVEETLRSRAAPSLALLGRLGQVGPLPGLVAALRSGDPLPRARAYARERESLGLGPGEVVGELLALGRVLESHGETVTRLALDRAVAAYVERVTSELADAARRDPLTGLLNQRAFRHDLAGEAARARRYGGALALVVFDLDRFKETNDRRGHQEGDRLLRAFAAALGDTLRETDRAGRIGGDEFAAFLLGASADAVAAFLRRLEERLPPELSVSAGAARLPAERAEAESLFTLADSRLYDRKRARAA